MKEQRLLPLLPPAAELLRVVEPVTGKTELLARSPRRTAPADDCVDVPYAEVKPKTSTDCDQIKKMVSNLHPYSIEFAMEEGGVESALMEALGVQAKVKQLVDELRRMSRQKRKAKR